MAGLISEASGHDSSESGALDNSKGVSCDDCPKPIRSWRWCTGCERVLCETCCIEGHTEHPLETYATSIRRSNEQFRQSIDQLRSDLKKLDESAEEVEELKMEIVTMLDAVKRELRAKFDESMDVETKLKEQFSSMAKLLEQPLNANKWNERNESMAAMGSSLEAAAKKQIDLEAYLKTFNALAEKAETKLSKVLRDGNEIEKQKS